MAVTAVKPRRGANRELPFRPDGTWRLVCGNRSRCPERDTVPLNRKLEPSHSELGTTTRSSHVFVFFSSSFYNDTEHCTVNILEMITKIKKKKRSMKCRKRPTCMLSNGTVGKRRLHRCRRISPRLLRRAASVAGK